VDELLGVESLDLHLEPLPRSLGAEAEGGDRTLPGLCLDLIGPEACEPLLGGQGVVDRARVGGDRLLEVDVGHGVSFSRIATVLQTGIVIVLTWAVRTPTAVDGRLQRPQ
jgi:hypothetical protein